MENITENKAIIERIKTNLAQFYNGASWVGENLCTRALSLEPDMAFKKVQWHSHSVAESLGHIMAWRNFAIQKLTGNDAYDIDDNSLADWPQPTDWDALIKDFGLCHNNLLSAIDNLPADRWNNRVPGRSYSFIFLVDGIVQHDYYHYGQIASLLAAIAKTQQKT